MESASWMLEGVMACQHCSAYEPIFWFLREPHVRKLRMFVGKYPYEFMNQS